MLTATVSVEVAPETTITATPQDRPPLLHPVVEIRSRADPGSHTLRTGVVALMDEDLLDWNIFLDRTSSTTALVLSVRAFSNPLTFSEIFPDLIKWILMPRNCNSVTSMNVLRTGPVFSGTASCGGSVRLVCSVRRKEEGTGYSYSVVLSTLS